jgi:hypothetical protein
MKPKFTDAHRYPHGYVPQRDSDVRKTFARERRRLKALEDAQKVADAEAAVKVRKIGKP